MLICMTIYMYMYVFSCLLLFVYYICFMYLCVHASNRVQYHTRLDASHMTYHTHDMACCSLTSQCSLCPAACVPASDARSGEGAESP